MYPAYPAWVPTHCRSRVRARGLTCPFTYPARTPLSHNRVQRAHHFVAGCGAMWFSVNHAPPSREPSTINSITWHAAAPVFARGGKHLSQGINPACRLENEDDRGQMSREPDPLISWLDETYRSRRSFLGSTIRIDVMSRPDSPYKTPGILTMLDDVDLRAIDQAMPFPFLFFFFVSDRMLDCRNWRLDWSGGRMKS